MEIERRAEPRFKLSRMVAYDLGREIYLKAKGVDISIGGMTFVSDEYVDPQLSVWLSFSIPAPDGTWHQLEAEGYVVSVSDSGDGCRFGVSFSRMSKEDWTDFEAFIDVLETDSQELKLPKISGTES
jgi:c-di-GMP-binding flagellar brake protein YcgR